MTKQLQYAAVTWPLVTALSIFKDNGIQGAAVAPDPPHACLLEERACQAAWHQPPVPLTPQACQDEGCRM